MPWLMFTNPRGQGERAVWDWGSKWMERRKEQQEMSRELQRSTRAPADVQPQTTSCSETLKRLLPWKDWCSFALVGIVWSVCQVEAPLHPSLFLVDPGCRCLQVCLLWLVLGGCVHALKRCLWRGQRQENPPLGLQQEAVGGNRTNLYERPPQPRSPGLHVPLALAVADCLLMSVLQEPLLNPSMAHIHALLSSLQSVSHALEKADIEELDQDSALISKVMLIRTFLQQRMESLGRLIQVQGDFEASIKDMLGGLDGLWAQLEDLHAGVTLTKEGSGGRRDLASAQTDAQTLFAVLSHHRSRLQCCQAHLTDSTQLLQELTWSHAHISNSVSSSSSSSSSSESVWPEKLLQSNIEQFNQVQENFLSLEHQTSTFQAHLQGLAKGNQDRHNYRASSYPVSPKTSPDLHSGRTDDVSRQHGNSTSTTTSVSSVIPDTDHTPSLCERSALHFSSTIGRLRKSGRKK